MGMDAVELIMEVEERFGVSIRDHDAEKLTTVGHLIDYVSLLTAEKRGEVCMTSRIFYKVRRALMSVVGVQRESVRLDTRLDTLIPKFNRRSKWNRLRQQLVELPRLSYSNAISALLWALFLESAALSTAFFANNKPLVGYSYFSMSCLVIGVLALRPFAARIPSQVQTIQKAVETVAVSPDLEIDAPLKSDVELIVRNIVSAQSGVRLDEISRDTDFTKDLNW